MELICRPNYFMCDDNILLLRTETINGTKYWFLEIKDQK